MYHLFLPHCAVPLFCERQTIGSLTALFAVMLRTAFIQWVYNTKKKNGGDPKTLPERHDQRVSELAVFNRKWMWWLVLSIFSAVLCNIHRQVKRSVTQTEIKVTFRQNTWWKVELNALRYQWFECTWLWTCVISAFSCAGPSTGTFCVDISAQLNWLAAYIFDILNL